MLGIIIYQWMIIKISSPGDNDLSMLYETRCINRLLFVRYYCELSINCLRNEFLSNVETLRPQTFRIEASQSKPLSASHALLPRYSPEL